MVANSKVPSSSESASGKAEHGPSPDAGSKAPGPLRREEAKKVLVLDDEPHLLAIYRKIIARLPSRPDVRISDNAGQALALLDSEPFDLFITDLRMPKIDGFQVLLSARRRLPDLKTVVLTGAASEQYRSRAYECGIDLFVEKPTTPAEFRLFGECIEALLLKGEKNRGFRGIQSKSLMDLVQFECLSQKSSALKITSGALVGHVWIADGNVIDAEAEGLRGEEAFLHIFAWKAGNFELMPGNPERERTIFTPYESLLLESAQTFDETLAAEGDSPRGKSRDLTLLATVRGVESLLLIAEDGQFNAWNLDRPERFVPWTYRVLRDFAGVGDILKAGALRAVQAAGRERGLAALPNGSRRLMAAMDRKMTVKYIRKAVRELANHLGDDAAPIQTAGASSAQHPCGSYTVTSSGKVAVSTLPSSFPRVIMEVIGKVVLSTLASARDLDCPLTELAADFPGIEVRARTVEGGAIIFITPQE